MPIRNSERESAKKLPSRKYQLLLKVNLDDKEHLPPPNFEYTSAFLYY
jgi:hypothetical protein